MSFATRKAPSLRAPKRRSFGSRLSEVFGLDLRSVGVLRIGIAICLLLDLAGRWPDLEAHYTDAGLLPRDVAIETADAWHISLHLANGQYAFQAILFAVAGASALFLLAGLHTRAAAFASWACIVSLQNRNFIILNGADVLLRMILFWSLFLPIGDRFSIDRLRGISRPAGENDWHVSPGTVFFLLQFMIVYVFAGLIKADIPVWREGTGLAYALRSPEFVGAFGRGFVDHMGAVKIVSGVVVVGELFGSLALLVPYGTKWARLAVVLSFCGLHMLIAATMSVGMFPLVGIVSALAFLPAAFWDRVTAISKRKFPSWNSAIDQLGMRLRGPVRARLDPIRPPSPARRWAGALVGSGCLVLVILCNVGAYRPLPFALPTQLTWITPTLRLEQRWDMFAQPLTSGGWFVIPARLTSGAEVDLSTMKDGVSWEEPPSIADTYPNARWKKYFMNISIAPYAQHRLLFGRYLCRVWNQNHPGAQSLEAFKIYFMREAVEPWRKPYAPQKQMLWQHECRDGLLNKWASLL